ncbi:MAG: hypothetical protein MRQ09_00110 [Candidatus Midichloria sp.]|nr:hypothetical protein [Candidatus Midichloria sp.]
MSKNLPPHKLPKESDFVNPPEYRKSDLYMKAIHDAIHAPFEKDAAEDRANREA